MANPFIPFLLCAAVIVAAGTLLSKAADVIAERTRLGGLWVGSVLLAGATSLPEVVTSFAAGAINAPDIAVGNVFGSNIFNCAILAFVDLFEGPGSILATVAPTHMLAAVLGMILSAVAAVFILLKQDFSLFGVGLSSVVLAAIYVAGVWAIRRFESRPEAERLFTFRGPDRTEREQALTATMSLTWAWVSFGLGAALILVSGPSLAKSADAIAETTRLGATFVGSVFVGAATSLPELVATLAAVRVGARDLAVGNVLGSNIFNMIIMIVADVSYRPGPILLDASPMNAVTALFGLILSGVILGGLFYRSKRNIAGLGPDTLCVLVTYVLAIYLLHKGGT